MKTIYAKVELDTSGAIKSVEQLDDALVKTTGNTSELTDEVTKNGGAMAILNQLTGGLAQQFKDSYEAVALSTKGLSGFRKALVATGIGAAVVGIGLLIENWDKLKGLITSTTAAQEAYKESIDKIVGSVGEMQTKLSKATDQIELAKKGIVDKDEALKLYNESLGEAVGYAESLEQAEALLVANANTVINITKLKAQAEVLYAKAAEGRAKVIAGDESLNPSFWQQLGNSILSFGNVAAYTANNTDSLVRNTNEALNQAVQLEKAAADVQKQIAEQEAALQKGGLSPEEVAKKNAKIAELRKQQVKDVKDNADKEVDIEAEKNAFLLAQRNALALEEDQRRQLELTKLQEQYDLLIAQAAQFGLDTLELEYSQQLALQNLRAEFDAQDKAREDAKAAQKLADEQSLADQLAQIETNKRASQMQTLDNAISIANEESALGKALLVAKQILSAREAIIEAQASARKAAQAVADASVKAAGAGVDISTGAAKTASSAAFPLNVPLIIAYAAQAVGIIASIRSATSKMKSAIPSAGGGISIAAPSIPQATVPQVNTVGSSGVNQLASVVESSMNRPVKAFVVSKDVSTAQEMDRNIIREAGI